MKTQVDVADRRILYQLDIDARQSFTNIGKKIGLSKNTVSYRIKRLREQGILQNFYTHIDAYRLGYISFRFYLTYQYTTPKIEQEILKYFLRSRHIWRIISIGGRYDLGVTAWVRDTNEFYHFWSKTMNKYREYFTNTVFSACINSYDYRYSFLLDEKYNKSDREKYEVTGGGKKHDIDDIDLKILNVIADEARLPNTSIAKQLHISPTMVAYRLRNLIDQDIIQAFRTTINLSSLGYTHVKVDVYLREYKKRYDLTNYIKLNPHLVHIGTSSGISDLELEFYVKDLDKLFTILQDLIKTFPNVIKNYEYFTILKVHKLRYMPQI